MHRPPDPELLGFLEAYDRHISDLALALREVILEEAPEAGVDLPSVHGSPLVRVQRKDEGHVLLHCDQGGARQPGIPAWGFAARPESVCCNVVFAELSCA